MTGLRLTVLAGRTVPRPLPPDATARLRQAVVTETDDARSAFTLTFDAGRTGPLAALDSPVVLEPPVPVNARVCLVVTLGAVPHVLFDGIATEATLTPGEGEGSATLQVTGQDVSLLLDREERDVEWPALDDHAQALAILGPYAAQGIVPLAIPPADADPPLPTDRVPTQHETDLARLTALAARHGYVTYTIPGPTPGTSTLYWGPPVRTGVPQPALSVDLGPETNVLAPPKFRLDSLGPLTVEGSVQDPRTGSVTAVRSTAPLRPPLAAVPVWSTEAAALRRKRYRESGPSTTTALARAQAEVHRSMDCVVGEGALDGSRYGSLLRPRGLVGVRGAGWSHDGLWYVRQVEHDLRPGSYRQTFTIAREGYGSTVPAVAV